MLQLLLLGFGAMNSGAWDVALAVLTSLGGGGVIVLGLSSWLGRVWADRLQANTVAKHSRELEGIRAEHKEAVTKLREEAAVLRARVSSLGDLQHATIAAAHQRTVDAQLRLWNDVLAIRNAASSYLFHHQLLLRTEVPRFFDKITEMLPATNMSKFDQQFQGWEQGDESQRPAVGESLWAMFHAYRAFSGRLAWHAVRCAERGRFQPWDLTPEGHQDAALGEIVVPILGDKVFSELAARDPGAPQAIRDALERRILVELNENLIGNRHMSIGLDQQERVLRAIREERK